FVEVTALRLDGRTMTSRTRVADSEAAVVLRAHAWEARRMQREKDLAGLRTVCEIRHADRGLPWRLDEPDLRGFRKDGARALHELASTVTRKSAMYRVPAHLDRKHLAALINRYVTSVK